MTENSITRRNKIMAVGITLAAIIILGGITFTFFSSIVSNTNNEKFQTETATMRLVFDDNDNGVSGTLNLGQSITKKFTIENTGTVDAYGKINWVDLVNTYMDGSLTWTLEQSATENGTYTIVGSGSVPTSATATTKVLKDSLLVPTGQTYYYKLTITLNNLDIDQSSDINASMHSKFNLQAGKEVLPANTIIQNLVKNANPNSTAVIDAPLEAKQETKYVLQFNGFADPEEYQSDTLEGCEEILDWFLGEFGSNASATCMLDNSTGKYDINASGDSSQAKYFNDETSCENLISDYSLQNTTCIEAEVTITPSCTNKLAYDGTVDNNLRYVGANPCNYVTFNDEVPYYGQRTSKWIYGWRIIGIMNNVDDGTGKKETRIKLIRNTSISSNISYSWDSSMENSGKGINDWSQADLKNELNGDYLDTTLEANPMWYNGDYNLKNIYFEYTGVLKSDAQALISNAKWNLGGISSDDYSSNYLKDIYGLERGTTVLGNPSGTCNDGACPRATSWTGKVALMHLSDMIYALDDGTNTRTECLNGTFDDISDCNTSNFLAFGGSTSTSSMPLLLNSVSNDNNVYTAASLGFISPQYPSDTGRVYPVVYLKADVKIASGDGSPESPFVFTIS